MPSIRWHFKNSLNWENHSVLAHQPHCHSKTRVLLCTWELALAKGWRTLRLLQAESTEHRGGRNVSSQFHLLGNHPPVLNTSQHPHSKGCSLWKVGAMQSLSVRAVSVKMVTDSHSKRMNKQQVNINIKFGGIQLWFVWGFGFWVVVFCVCVFYGHAPGCNLILLTLIIYANSKLFFSSYD